MNVRVYQRNFQPHANKYIKAFIDGLKRHGEKGSWLNVANYEPSDLAVIWGVRHPHIIQGQRERGLDYLVMERGYFGDRMKCCSLGFNGLNGHAEFCAENSPADRWEKHGVEVKPWRTGGDYALVMGQVDGDQSVQGVDLPVWYCEVLQKLGEKTDAPIYFRPHPQARQRVGFSGFDGLKTWSLDEALGGAFVAVTYNSNSGVDAALAGIPVVAMNRGSMAWEVASREVDFGHTPDRAQWLNDLAHKQWTIEEIAAGDAWAHLQRKYE